MSPEIITGAETNKIAAIFENTPQICKTQCHWSSQMEWPGIKQSASATHRHMEYAHVFLVLSFGGRGWTKKIAVIGVEKIV